MNWLFRQFSGGIVWELNREGQRRDLGLAGRRTAINRKAALHWAAGNGGSIRHNLTSGKQPYCSDG